ncbi:MAG: MFS transporter [Bacteroidales bacterium]
MKTIENSTSSWQSIIAAFFGFFIMGFVDVVGIATNYIKSDFSLSSTMANLIPMMVFLWFAIFSIPTGILMGRIGRKKTVIISLSISTLAMIIPYFSYTFAVILVAFALLGISNTILQVSLNPLVAAMFDKRKTASMLTTGQFVKAISSFLGPIIAGFAANYFGDWKYIFVIFSVASLLSVILLLISKIHETGFENAPSTFKGVLSLLKNNYILSCFLCILLIVGVDVGMNTSVPELIMKRTGLELSKAGLGTSVYFAARTLGSFLGAIILLKVMPIKYLKLSLYVAIATFIVLLFANNLWLLLVAVFIVGFACSNVFSIIFSFALQQNPTRSNEISALMIMGVSGGAIILPLQGIVSDQINFLAALFILLICLILILFFTRKLKENV